MNTKPNKWITSNQFKFVIILFTILSLLEYINLITKIQASIFLFGCVLGILFTDWNIRNQLKKQGFKIK